MKKSLSPQAVPETHALAEMASDTGFARPQLTLSDEQVKFLQRFSPEYREPGLAAPVRHATCQPRREGARSP